MSSISSITKAVSGLIAAQKGLQVTGHNISNMNTNGYTRQQLLQSESPYLNVGNTATNTMQVGLGVTCDEIRQIRDALADKRLRTEKSVLCYYQTLNTATNDIEAMFDEPYGDTISDFMNDFWSQTQKLSTAPSEVEERMSFISAAKVLVDKIKDVNDSLTNYQYHLNSNIETSVNRINQIAAEIRVLNEKISISEVNGDRANDYRDERNLLLDELSEYGEISYYEEPSRQIKVKFEGHQIINGEFPISIELEEIEGSPFSKPVWSDSKDEIFDLTEVSSSVYQNDSGKLKALLIARGEKVINTTQTQHQYTKNYYVQESVKRINDIIDGIGDLNLEIKNKIALGENTTTLEGERKALIDELKQYGKVKEFPPETDGTVKVEFEEHPIQGVNIIYDRIEDSPFSTPIWSDTRSEVIDLTHISPTSTESEVGKLAIQLVERGSTVQLDWDEIALNDNFSVDVHGNAYMIPKIQRMLDQYTNELVNIVNENFTGTGIGGHRGKDGVPVFVPIHISEENQIQLDTLREKFKDSKQALLKAQQDLDTAKKRGDSTIIANAEKALQRAENTYDLAKSDYETIQFAVMGAGNVQVNPLLLENGGHNLLGTIAKALDGSQDNIDNKSDNSMVEGLLSDWKRYKNWYKAGPSSSPQEKTVTLSTFFTELVTDIGANGKVYDDKASEKNKSVVNIENERQSMGGVSMDEEFTYMLKYQYAYNASSRMITMLDSMLDTIINRM